MKRSDPSATKEVLYKKSKEEGDRWIQKNSELLSKLSIPWSVVRWNYWLTHPKFNDLLNEVKTAYETELSYRTFFDENIEIYLERLKKRGELKVEKEMAQQYCLDYLQEECAAMCLWVETRCEYELYASGRTPAMEATYQRFIRPLHSELLKPLSLKFKHDPIDSKEVSSKIFAP